MLRLWGVVGVGASTGGAQAVKHRSIQAKMSKTAAPVAAGGQTLVSGAMYFYHAQKSQSSEGGESTHSLGQVTADTIDLTDAMWGTRSSKAQSIRLLVVHDEREDAFLRRFAS